MASLAQTKPEPPAACAGCHVEALTQPTTYMSHALERVDTCTVLTEHPSLSTTIGKYTYRIERKGSQSTYSVSGWNGYGDHEHRLGDGRQFRLWARLTFWRRMARCMRAA